MENQTNRNFSKLKPRFFGMTELLSILASHYKACFGFCGAVKDQFLHGSGE